jgi:hypothetical protein
MFRHPLAFGLAGAMAACFAVESLHAQVALSSCDPGAFRTCNSVQIVAQPLSAVPFETFSLTWRNRPGFGGPFVADTTAGAVDLSPRQWDLVADPFILSGYSVARARPNDLPHLLASMRGGRGAGGRGGKRGGNAASTRRR